MWTEYLNEDLKFTIYAAKFTPGVEGTLVLTNTEREYLTLDTTIEFAVGDQIKAYNDNSITTLVGEGTIIHYNSITKEAEVRRDSGQFFTSGYFGNESAIQGEYVRSDKLINAISPTLAHLSFNNASVAWSYKIYESDGTAYGDYYPLSALGTTELTSEKAVFSRSAFASSFKTKGVLATSTSSLSPIIDLNKQACVIAANKINPSSTKGYISRTVVLDDGQDAEDLRVYLSAFLPSSTQVLVYSKILHASDPTNFDDRPWTLMNKNKVTTSSKFNEYFYTQSRGSTDLAQYRDAKNVLYTGFRTFAIKIVMVGGTEAVPYTIQAPIIRDLRAIALLV